MNFNASGFLIVLSPTAAALYKLGSPIYYIYLYIDDFQYSLVLIAGGHPLIKPTLKPPSEPSKRKCVGSIFLADVLQYKRDVLFERWVSSVMMLLYHQKENDW